MLLKDRVLAFDANLRLSSQLVQANIHLARESLEVLRCLVSQPKALGEIVRSRVAVMSDLVFFQTGLLLIESWSCRSLVLEGRVVVRIGEGVFNLCLEVMIDGVVEEFEVSTDLLKVVTKLELRQQLLELLVHGLITFLS